MPATQTKDNKKRMNNNKMSDKYGLFQNNSRKRQINTFNDQCIVEEKKFMSVYDIFCPALLGILKQGKGNPIRLNLENIFISEQHVVVDMNNKASFS